MCDPTKNIASWCTVDPQLMVRRLKGDSSRQSVAKWTINKGISPLDLYVYLKARFGPPNGFQMTLKTPSSDNLIHWHWTLQCGARVIEFMGYLSHSVVAIDNCSNPTETEIDEFISNLKSDFATYGGKMAAVRKSLEKWWLFTNPYFRIRKVVTLLSDQLRALDLDNLTIPSCPTSPDKMDKYHKQMAKCNRIYTEALSHGVTLRMIAPVLAECFVNLLIFLISKPEIRNDKHVYESELRKNIDVRVKTLHLICEGFTSAIDTASPAFKDFQSLMNNRNFLLHGNTDPIQLKYDIVHFDNTIPLLGSYENLIDLAFANSLVKVEPETALKDIDCVNKFISHLLNYLQPQIRRSVELVMCTSDLGWMESQKRVGILFPSVILGGIF